MFKFIQKDSWFPSRDNMLSMVKYSLPLTFAWMMGTLSLQLDQLIVSSLCTPEEFAVYTFGAIEIPLIGILTGSIATVILPDIRRFVVAGKNSEALALFRQAAEKSAWILFPTMLFLLVSADSFMRTFFSAKYAASVTPFRIHLLILPGRIVYFGTLQMALGQTKAIFFRELIGLVINILLGILIVKNIGYIGAAYAKVISMYAWNLSANLFLVSRSMNVSWSAILPFQRLGKIIVYFAIPTLFIILTNQVHFKMSWLQLMVNAAIFCCSGLFVCGKPFIECVLPNYRNTMSYRYLENIYNKIATGSFV